MCGSRGCVDSTQVRKMKCACQTKMPHNVNPTQIKRASCLVEGINVDQRHVVFGTNHDILSLEIVVNQRDLKHVACEIPATTRRWHAKTTRNNKPTALYWEGSLFMNLANCN